MRKAFLRLCKLMKYSTLRSDQRKVVLEYMNWKDVFLSLHSILPLAFDSVRSSTCSKSIVLVVIPLIALMKEQVLRMEEGCVTSLYSGDIDDSRRSKVCQGEYQLIFMSPESLLDSAFWYDILRTPVSEECSWMCS